MIVANPAVLEQYSGGSRGNAGCSPSSRISAPRARARNPDVSDAPRRFPAAVLVAWVMATAQLMVTDRLGG
jgi:hypothetical protein